MNYNVNSGMRHGASRKPKRVSDINAMGSPDPQTVPPIRNPGMQQFQAQVPFSQYDPYAAGVANPTQQTGYGDYAPQYVQQPYANVQQQHPGTAPVNPQFQMLSQPIVQDMAFQYGQQLASTGTTAVKKEIEKYIPVTRLKYYFAVDTKYVLTKLGLLFFPFTHKDWSIKYEQESPVQPRYEINAPDLYIPVMAYVTYVVMAGLVLGMQDRFTPEQIGIYASSALVWSLVEMAVYTATLYIANIKTTLKTLDLLAYSGYKYVGIIISVLFSLVFASAGYYIVLLYSSIALAFFLVRALKAQVLPEHQSDQTHQYGAPAVGSKRRLYFLLFVAITQPLLSWWLSLHFIRYSDVKATP